MSKYYCKFCKSIVIPGPECEEPILEDSTCNICKQVNTIVKVSDYETINQSEERAGKAYPKNGLVWARFTKEPLNIEWTGWHIYEYQDAINDAGDFDCQMICISPSLPPPDDWKPEV